MSLLGISQAAQSSSLRDRIAACVAEQISTGAYLPPEGHEGHPLNAANSIQWACAAEPGWGAAWESALAAGNADPGSDPAVIPDAWILAACQRLLGVGAS